MGDARQKHPPFILSPKFNSLQPLGLQYGYYSHMKVYTIAVESLPFG